VIFEEVMSFCGITISSKCHWQKVSTNSCVVSFVCFQ
jgi:hypothetical protein